LKDVDMKSIEMGNENKNEEGIHRWYSGKIPLME
jgi:hypothetical protein